MVVLKEENIRRDTLRGNYSWNKKETDLTKMKLLKIFGFGIAVSQRVPIRVPNNIDLEELQSEAISSLQGSMAGKYIFCMFYH